MALANKKQKSLYNKSDSNSKFYMTNDKETRFSSSFANGDHIQDEAIADTVAPLIYQLKLMEEDIDELRRYITNEATGAAINTKTLNVSNLPTSAAGLSSGQLWVRNEKDGTKTIKSA